MPHEPVIRIKVTVGGDITADGRPVTLEELAAELAAFGRSGGLVLYHREDPAGEPHPNAMRVMALVVENRLPIQLCVQPDFSGSVDAAGTTRPGEDRPRGWWRRLFGR